MDKTVVFSTNSNRIRDYGLNIDYNKNDPLFSYQLGAGYLSNLANTLYVSSSKALSSNLGNKNLYVHAVPALDLHGSFKVKPFDIIVKYIGAFQTFNVNDIPYTRNGGNTIVGAKPAAWGMNLGYSFPLFAYDSRVSVGYQGSKEAVALGTASGSTASSFSGVYGTFFAIGLPKNRYFANYGIDFHRSFRTSAELAYEGSYSASNGGTNTSGWVGILLLTARFV